MRETSLYLIFGLKDLASYYVMKGEVLCNYLNHENLVLFQDIW